MEGAGINMHAGFSGGTSIAVCQVASTPQKWTRGRDDSANFRSECGDGSTLSKPVCFKSSVAQPLGPSAWRRMLALKSCVFNLSIFEAENMTVAKWGSLGGGGQLLQTFS